MDNITINVTDTIDSVVVNVYEGGIVNWGSITGTLANQIDLQGALDLKLSNIVEDITPQLGGDLDLNGKNIDFPSTVNISDCLDEDNMASDSATKLATQQSIKAYADTKIAKSIGTTKGDIIGFSASGIPVRLGVGTNDQVLTAASGEASGLKWAAASGGGLQETIIGKFWAGDFDYFETSIAPLDLDTGTNVLKIKRQLFDDTTEEFVNFQLHLPSDLVGTETIYVDIYGYSATAAASKNVKMKFYHSARAVGESWDAAYATDDSGDIAVSGTQDFIDKITISDTVANYGWAAGDIVFCKLSHVNASADDLVGDYCGILVIVRRG